MLLFSNVEKRDRFWLMFIEVTSIHFSFYAVDSHNAPIQKLLLFNFCSIPELAKQVCPSVNFSTVFGLDIRDSYSSCYAVQYTLNVKMSNHVLLG